MTQPNPQVPDAHPALPRFEIVALRALLGSEAEWALFEHGTVVLLTPDIDKPVEYAKLRLYQDAPMRAGSAAGDFSVSKLPSNAGFLVSSHDPKVFTIVRSSEVSARATEVTIGMAGRAAHGADVDGGRVVHVQTRRGHARRG